MSRLAAWCQQGGRMFSADDLKRRIDSEDRVLGYECPSCRRVVKASEWSDARRFANADSPGWIGTSGMRWPRHYSWAQGMKPAT